MALESTLCGLNHNSSCGLCHVHLCRVLRIGEHGGVRLQYNPIRSDFDSIFRSFSFFHFYFSLTSRTNWGFFFLFLFLFTEYMVKLFVCL